MFLLYSLWVSVVFSHVPRCHFLTDIYTCMALLNNIGHVLHNQIGHIHHVITAIQCIIVCALHLGHVPFLLYAIPISLYTIYRIFSFACLLSFIARFKQRSGQALTVTCMAL